MGIENKRRDFMENTRYNFYKEYTKIQNKYDGVISRVKRMPRYKWIEFCFIILLAISIPVSSSVFSLSKIEIIILADVVLIGMLITLKITKSKDEKNEYIKQKDELEKQKQKEIEQLLSVYKIEVKDTAKIALLIQDAKEKYAERPLQTLYKRCLLFSSLIGIPCIISAAFACWGNGIITFKDFKYVVGAVLLLFAAVLSIGVIKDLISIIKPNKYEDLVYELKKLVLFH